MNVIASKIVIPALRAYKRLLSPLFLPACRYVPTCSEYAVDAIEQFGLWRGCGMAIWRVLRCHPFSKGGYDPAWKAQVPQVHTSEPCGH